MEVRKFREGDEKELWELFYNTIHNINIQDYDKAQVTAWAPDDLGIDLEIGVRNWGQMRIFRNWGQMRIF